MRRHTQGLKALALLMLVAVGAMAQQPTPQQLREIMRQAQQNPEAMKILMQGAQQMQACLGKLDQSAMERLRARGEEMQAEIKRLCTSGARDEAQQKTIAYAKEMSSAPELAAIRQCGEMAQQMMANLPFASPGAGDAADSAQICDSFSD